MKKWIWLVFFLAMTVVDIAIGHYILGACVAAVGVLLFFKDWNEERQQKKFMEIINGSIHRESSEKQAEARMADPRDGESL